MISVEADSIEQVPQYESFRPHFPMLDSAGYYIYFDSGATSLKPLSVIEAVSDVLRTNCSNVGRGNHLIAEEITLAYEAVRTKVSNLLNCHADEIAFTYNCTDSINIVSQSIHLDGHDQVILSELEHHSNLLPWVTKANVKVVRTLDDGTVDLEHLEELLGKPTKLVSITYVSNVTGNVQPVSEICRLASKHGALSLIDSAQAVGHFPIDVQSVGCDFLAFSAHKMLGPSGVGVLYVKRSAQEALGLGRVGGGMVNHVTGNYVSYQSGARRFEAGTPNIEGVVGLGAAIDYLVGIGIENVHRHNRMLSKYFLSKAEGCESIYFPFPTADNRIPVFTFRPKSDIDINYISRILSDNYEIAVSAGFQCNQPLYRSKRLDGGIRVSMHLYNSFMDIDRLFEALKELSVFLE